LAIRWLCISIVVLHLALTTSAIFLLILYNEQMLMMDGCLLILDLPFGALQFTVYEVQSVLLELDVSKGACTDGIQFFILKNCAFAFARPLSLLFNRSLSTCVFDK
jgi:hypothetical protein